MKKIEIIYQKGNLKIKGLNNLNQIEKENFYKILLAQFLAIIKYNLNKNFEELKEEIYDFVWNKYKENQAELDSRKNIILNYIITLNNNNNFNVQINKEFVELIDYAIIINLLTQKYKEEFNKEIDYNEISNLADKILKSIN